MSVNKMLTEAEEASIVLTDKQLDITYIAKNGMLPENFSINKEDTLRKLLEIDRIFEGGFSVSCESKKGLDYLLEQNTSMAARPLLDNLDKLAIAIHEFYNDKKKERNPEKPLEYPSFSDLPDTLKYSNLRQARSIGDKLGIMGWEMRPIGSDGKLIAEIPGDPDEPESILEFLAKIEHDDWVQERLSSGWKLGEVKNIDKKISPYLIPYDELTEEIKDYDRDTIRNIPMLLGMIGMAVYAK